MSNIAKNQSQPVVSREEKMGILSALLGPTSIAKLHAKGVDVAKQTSASSTPADAQRMEWHRNRLLERFRGRLNTVPSAHSESQTSKRAQGERDLNVDQRLSKLADLEDLAQEHPAVITRLLSRMSQSDRVQALKTLPGPVARAVVRRLR